MELDLGNNKEDKELDELLTTHMGQEVGRLLLLWKVIFISNVVFKSPFGTGGAAAAVGCCMMSASSQKLGGELVVEEVVVVVEANKNHGEDNKEDKQEERTSTVDRTDITTANHGQNVGNIKMLQKCNRTILQHHDQTCFHC